MSLIYFKQKASSFKEYYLALFRLFSPISKLQSLNVRCSMAIKEKHKLASDWLDLLNGLIPHGTIVELPVLTGSMVPLIVPGNTIRIMALSGKQIRRGDIIVFREGKTLTTHRLLARFTLGTWSIIYQKGDVNRLGKWIHTGQVVGMVVAVQDKNGLVTTISNRDGDKKARNEALRQLALACWNTALLFPRFIKNKFKIKIHGFRMEIGDSVIGITCPTLKYFKYLSDYFSVRNSEREPDITVNLNFIHHEESIEIPDSLFTTKKIMNTNFIIAHGLVHGKIGPEINKIQLWVKTGLAHGQAIRVFEQLLYKLFS